ncbi:hypothetical protein KJ969_04875, partial [Patescibacteria group bacterium]|nr:hypothetical protein [Patescibacteria group bacterium]
IFIIVIVGSVEKWRSGKYLCFYLYFFASEGGWTGGIFRRGCGFIFAGLGLRFLSTGWALFLHRAEGV